jgi:hypothetical protein
VTSIFTRHGVTRKVTYQTEPRAIEILCAAGVRSGDQIPRGLFHELLEDGLLFTGGSGAGEEIADKASRNVSQTKDQQGQRRQIPIDVTSELLQRDGTFISFGAFKLLYGGPTGYGDDILRTAYRALSKKHQFALEQQLQNILSAYKPAAIKREADKVVVEFVA